MDDREQINQNQEHGDSGGQSQNDRDPSGGPYAGGPYRQTGEQNQVYRGPEYQRSEYQGSGGYPNGQYGQYDQYGRPTEPRTPKNNMATASMVLGIISIVTSCCCYGGLIFGSVGVLFALLSRVDGKFESNAKTGLITSIIGLSLVALLVLVWLFIMVLGAARSGLYYGGVYHTLVFEALRFPGGMV